MTAKRLLMKLRKIGIVSMPKKGEYRIREEARALREFSRDFLMDAHEFFGALDLDFSVFPPAGLVVAEAHQLSNFNIVQPIRVLDLENRYDGFFNQSE